MVLSGTATSMPEAVAEPRMSCSFFTVSLPMCSSLEMWSSTLGISTCAGRMGGPVAQEGASESRGEYALAVSTRAGRVGGGGEGARGVRGQGVKRNAGDRRCRKLAVKAPPAKKAVHCRHHSPDPAQAFTSPLNTHSGMLTLPAVRVRRVATTKPSDTAWRMLMGCPRRCSALTSRRKGGLRPDSIASEESAGGWAGGRGAKGGGGRAGVEAQRVAMPARCQQLHRPSHTPQLTGGAGAGGGCRSRHCAAPT